MPSKGGCHGSGESGVPTQSVAAGGDSHSPAFPVVRGSGCSPAYPLVRGSGCCQQCGPSHNTPSPAHHLSSPATTPPAGRTGEAGGGHRHAARERWRLPLRLPPARRASEEAGEGSPSFGHDCGTRAPPRLGLPRPPRFGVCRIVNGRPRLHDASFSVGRERAAKAVFSLGEGGRPARAERRPFSDPPTAHLSSQCRVVAPAGVAPVPSLDIVNIMGDRSPLTLRLRGVGEVDK